MFRCSYCSYFITTVHKKSPSQHFFIESLAVAAYLQIILAKSRKSLKHHKQSSKLRNVKREKNKDKLESRIFANVESLQFIIFLFPLFAQSSASRQSVFRQFSDSRQTVVRWLSGSHQAVARQSSGSRQAVIRQSSGSHQAAIWQLSQLNRSGIHQTVFWQLQGAY